jgi:hypothetical protein
MAARYKALGKSYTAQRQFRLSWAQEQYDSLVVKRTKRVSQSNSFGSFGTQRSVLGAG